MASGMGVDSKVIEDFTNMKLRKSAKIMTFKIEGDKIVVEKTMTSGAVADLKAALPKEESRYAVFDTEKKLVFVLWTPDASSVKDKMTYTSSKDSLHKRLEGVTPVAFNPHEHADCDSIMQF
eukprot:GHVQ01001243.1.p1 GENE.GHVQ01001243.1~~GHVQ01001243.1.p1  ORF type:complete len:122 (+),score=25.51 GHVQ01001243.1:347-712(+)